MFWHSICLSRPPSGGQYRLSRLCWSHMSSLDSSEQQNNHKKQQRRKDAKYGRARQKYICIGDDNPLSWLTARSDFLLRYNFFVGTCRICNVRARDRILSDDKRKLSLHKADKQYRDQYHYQKSESLLLGMCAWINRIHMISLNDFLRSLLMGVVLAMRSLR